MNDAVPDAQDARTAVLGSKPGSESVESVTPIAYRRIQLLLGDLFALGVLDREPWRGADPLDLTPRLQSPALGARPPVHAELEAR
jgi:hypothetical protein